MSRGSQVQRMGVPSAEGLHSCHKGSSCCEPGVGVPHLFPQVSVPAFLYWAGTDSVAEWVLVMHESMGSVHSERK